MGIIKNTIKKQIDVNNTQKYFSSTATIESYDPVTNTAAITFKNPNGDGTLFRKNVPIADTLGGINGYNLKPNDKCSIDFRGGNVFMPIITGVVKTFYREKINTNQGACLVDEYLYDVKEPEDISPMCNDWIDEDNFNDSKYNDESAQYMYSEDENEEYNKIIRDINHYSNDEQGITHIDNHSTVKIKENGDIEMFVDNNIGLRISKKMQKIYVYGLTVEMQ